MNEKSESVIFELAKIRQCAAVQQLVFEPTMDSTNDWALKNLEEFDASFPLLVLTDHQLAGRGRGTNRWISDQGSLTFSYVVDLESLNLEPVSRSLLPLSSGLAIVRTIDRLAGAKCQIKWPNDVMLNGQKIAGVLVESIIRSRCFVVIGIGINLTTTIDASLLPHAGSVINDHLQGPLDPTQVLVELLTELSYSLGMLVDQPDWVIDQCNAKSWLTGSIVCVENGAHSISGIVMHIDTQGGLVLRSGTGIETTYSGQVKIEID